MSSTTGPNFPNFATSPTMRTSEARPRASSSARASSVRPSSGTKALSTPIRVLLPPARMKAVTSGMGRSYTPPPCALKGLHHGSLPNPEYPRGGTPQRKHPQANPLYSNALSPGQRSPVHEGNLFKRGGSGEDEPCVWRSTRFESNHHAAETHGCSYAWAVLSRVFLAEAWRRRRILPGLPAVRGRIQVRLGDHAPRRARRTRQT